MGAAGRPSRYANVVSSGATIPARAPASIDMLQIVIRFSIDRLRIASPVYSSTCPTPPATPSRPIAPRIMSFAVTPGGASPSKRTRIDRGRTCGRHCVASTCSTSDVPTPNASAPNAPCVDVWLSPQTIVIPGCVTPSSGPITCTIPSRPCPVAKSGTPNSAQLRRRASSCAFASGSVTGPSSVGHVVVHRRERQVRPSHGSPGQPEAVEGLRRGDLVDQVQVDEQQRRLALGGGDDVSLPDPVEQRFRHGRMLVTKV